MTKKERKSIITFTIIVIAIVMLCFAIWIEVRKIFEDLPTAQMLQRQGVPSSRIDGITLLWFVLVCASIYMLLECIGRFFIQLETMKKTIIQIVKRKRKEKKEAKRINYIGQVAEAIKWVKKENEISEYEKLLSEQERIVLEEKVLETLKSVERKKQPTGEEWAEIKNDFQSLSNEELECITSYDVTW